MKYINYLLLNVCLVSGIIYAQENVVASGDSFFAATGSVSFTVGQIDYLSYGNSENVSEGVQQIFSLPIIGLAEPKEIYLKVFPNPTQQIIQIVLSEMTENLQYQLFDIMGKSITKGEIHSENQMISIASFSLGTYILQIYSDQKPVHSIQIIKN